MAVRALPAATLDVIGGVTGSLSGVHVTTSGDVEITSTGTLNVVTDGDIVASAGGIVLRSYADLNTGGQSAGAAVRGLGGGTVLVIAATDLNLGNAAGNGSVTSAAGEMDIVALRNLNMNANAAVTSGGTGIVYVVSAPRTTPPAHPSPSAPRRRFPSPHRSFSCSSPPHWRSSRS